MSKKPKAKAKAPAPVRKSNTAAIVVAWTLAAVAAGAGVYQATVVNELRVENAALTAKLEAAQADRERASSKLDDAQARVLALTAEVARFDPEQVTLLEENLATAQAEAEALRAELAGAQAALAEKDAEVAELASNILPPPPAAEVLPPPLYAAADFGDPHVDVALDQYLAELLTTLADDRNAPQLASVHPLGVLYAEENDLLLQGTVGSSQRYRVTEWHTLNEYQDIVLDSLVVIDAPEGTNALTRVQQALTSTRGAGELTDDGLLKWEVGTKAITLHPTSDATRATLHIEDSYELPETMQVYNRR